MQYIFSSPKFKGPNRNSVKSATIGACMTRLNGKARAKANKKKRNKHKNDFFLRRKNLLGEIIKYDDPMLSIECEVVPEGQDVKDIFKKMKQVLNATENGVGLAASQIGVAKKMIIIKSDSSSRDITCMINPEIETTSRKMKFGKEGCLSYPNTYAFIERFTVVSVSYCDENWKKHTVEYEEGNILGIVIQHELEHLLEGHCQIHDWWKDPEGKKKELEERFKPQEEDTSSEIVESEDKKKENAENEDAL
jgi:peptide deformylase